VKDKGSLLPIVTMLAGVSMLFAEPSVYGFDSDSKTVIQNKKEITALRRQVALQKERINGLTTVVEGLSATINELQQRNTKADPSSNNDQTALLKELGSMIDNINENYVSKAELQKILENKEYRASAVSQKIESISKSKGSGGQSPSVLGKRSVSKLYSEGVRLFQKKRYDEAKKRFDITDTNGYKPAATNYYLGEIAYYTKHYDDAIFYFKKSAGLYDKAGYIDTLLLHTAVSLEKAGDKTQAKRFYENIVANYPERKTAQIAKRKLKHL